MPPTNQPPADRTREAAADLDDPTAVDPVCGMDVDPVAGSGLKLERDGKTYHFCSPECRRAFEENPSDYEI